MAMDNSFSVAWETHVEPPRIYSIGSNMYMTILQLGQVSHILVFTDSSSALGWIHKTSYDPVNSGSHDYVARWIGWTLVSNETCLYSQHVKGTEEIIADSLSQDFHISDQTLTKTFNRILTL